MNIKDIKLTREKITELDPRGENSVHALARGEVTFRVTFDFEGTDVVEEWCSTVTGYADGYKLYRGYGYEPDVAEYKNIEWEEMEEPEWNGTLEGKSDAWIDYTIEHEKEVTDLVWSAADTLVIIKGEHLA